MRLVKPLWAVLLLSLFLLPQVEKAMHHHSHEDFSIEGVQTIHKLAEKCAICEFEFSVFDILELGFHSISTAKTYFSFLESYSRFIFNILVCFSERGPPSL